MEEHRIDLHVRVLATPSRFSLEGALWEVVEVDQVEECRRAQAWAATTMSGALEVAEEGVVEAQAFAVERAVLSELAVWRRPGAPVQRRLPEQIRALPG